MVIYTLIRIGFDIALGKKIYRSLVEWQVDIDRGIAKYISLTVGKTAWPKPATQAFRAASHFVMEETLALITGLNHWP